MLVNILTISGSKGGIAMTIGQKIGMLKNNSGYKNYQELGKVIGVSGDWLNDLSKKDNITTIDITRLIKIAEYFNISLDWLLKDENDNYVVDIQQGLSENDIGIMIDKVQEKIAEGNNQLYGIAMTKESEQIAVDALDIVKNLIKQNL